MVSRPALVLILPLAGLMLAACGGGSNDANVTGAAPPPQVSTPSVVSPPSAAASSVAPSPTVESLPPPTGPDPGVAQTSSGDVGADVGDVAYPFKLPSTDGVEVSLESYRGEQRVVLVFYRAFW